MRFRKTITILTMIIIVMAFMAASYGIMSRSGQGNFALDTVRQRTVTVYGIGLYKNESVSMASQAIAQDFVTLFLGVPLLIFSLYRARKGDMKGRLLFLGILGYFLYTYASYSFCAMYNSFFLIYVTLMSASFFTFILTIMGFNINSMKTYFNPRLPVRPIGIMLIFIGAAVSLMWFKRIAGPLMSGGTPAELEHYTTLVIQALDLGILLPAGILAGVLIIKRDNYGYLLAPVIIIKEAALLIVITAMTVSQIMAGVHIALSEIVIFPLLALIILYCMYLVLSNVEVADL